MQRKARPDARVLMAKPAEQSGSWRRWHVGRAVRSACALMLLVVASPMAPWATPSVRAGQPDPVDATLTTLPVEQPLAAGETHTYRLTLRVGDFVRIAI